MSDPDPSKIMQTAMAFRASKALLSAVGLGIYSELARQKLTAAEIARRFGLVVRPATDLLDGLVSLGLMTRDGDGGDARYGNTPDTAMYLDRASPAYLGGLLEMLDARLFGFWDHLTEALRTGEAQSEVKQSSRSFFETLSADPPRLQMFLAAMSGVQAANFALLAERFPFGRYRSLCDVGGADGSLCMAVSAAHPDLACTCIDLPAVSEIAARRIAERGLQNRISAMPGDMFAGPLPRADVITMGMILHDWNLEKKKQLVAAAYAALPDGGAFIAIEALIDDARRENTRGLMMSLNMLIELGDGFDYTGAEFRRWCGDVGFQRFEVIPLTGEFSAAVAYK